MVIQNSRTHKLGIQKAFKNQLYTNTCRKYVSYQLYGVRPHFSSRFVAFYKNHTMK